MDVMNICSKAALLFSLLMICGCGPTYTFDKDIVTRLGTFEGTAPPRRVMGSSMTGVWTVGFYKDDKGDLYCKCTLQLHDSQSGWNRPESETAKMEILPGEETGKCRLKGTGKDLFDDVIFNEVSPESGSVKEAFLFDNDTVEVVLQRKGGADPHAANRAE